VPIFTFMTCAYYGAGNFGMAGRAYQPRLLFTWPNHKIAVMGGEQLAGVLEILKRDAAEKSGVALDEKGLATTKQMIRAQIERESDAFFATARAWDDGIIDPRDSRHALGVALSAAFTRHIEPTTSFGVFRH
jgi:acetyl-CoA carboxylase carboxyltransferase component